MPWEVIREGSPLIRETRKRKAHVEGVTLSEGPGCLWGTQDTCKDFLTR